MNGDNLARQIAADILMDGEDHIGDVLWIEEYAHHEHEWTANNQRWSDEHNIFIEELVIGFIFHFLKDAAIIGHHDTNWMWKEYWW